MTDLLWFYARSCSLRSYQVFFQRSVEFKWADMEGSWRSPSGEGFEFYEKMRSVQFVDPEKRR